MSETPSAHRWRTIISEPPADPTQRMITPAGDLIIVPAAAAASSIAMFEVVPEAGTIITGNADAAHILMAETPGTVRVTRWLERQGRDLAMMNCTEPAYLAYRGGIWINPGTYVIGERGWRWGV